MVRIFTRLLLSFLCALVAVLGFSLPGDGFAADAKAPPAAASSKPADAQPPVDPLGRTTPYGTVMGFLRAVDHGDYKAAVTYLEGKQSAREKEQRARDLATVLNRGLKIHTDDLSRAPEGRLDDDYVSPYMEKVGTAVYGERSLDIILRRTTRSDAPPLWLFSSETLLGVASAAEHFDVPWAEAIWPESFRDIRVQGYPLFRLLNLLVSIPVGLAIAWLLTVVLMAALRPLVRRSGGEAEGALTGMKWLFFFLLFCIVARVGASHAITAAARIALDYVATVLLMIAVSWLLIRLTKIATVSRIRHLRLGGSPGKIAAVELFGWLIVCVWMIAGLFLILRRSGLELTAALAGLGVGGIAIAFAAQKTLENLFGTVMLVGDEVVKVGEYCQAGTIEGHIESIGLRSTRIRTLDQVVVTIPNGQLAAMNVGNLARRDKLLFRHNIRLRYDTTPDQLRAILARVRTMMSEHPRLDPASVRVRLVRFGDSALELEAFAYAATREGEVFLEIQEELLLRIMDVIEASGTAIAPRSAAALGSDKVAFGIAERR